MKISHLGNVIFLLLFLLFNFPIYAQWTDDLSVNTLIVSKTGDQLFNAYANMPAEFTLTETATGTVVCWHDESGGDFDIYAQKMDSMGYLLWDPDGMPVCTDSGDQRFASVVADDDGGVLICWQDESGADKDVYAQKLDVDGNQVWASKLAIDASSDDQSYPKMCSDDAGGGIIVWSTDNGTDHDLRAQRIDTDGNFLWGSYASVCTETGNQLYPVIIPSGSNGALIAWEDYRNTVHGPDIYGQKLSSGGSKLWDSAGLMVCGASLEQSDPVIAPDEMGGMYVTWHDYRYGRDYNVYVQRVYSNGSKWTADVAVADGSADQYWPYIDNNGSDGAFVTWWTNAGTSGDYIYVSYVNSDGTIESTTLASNYLDDKALPSVFCKGDGYAYVCWLDRRVSPNKVYGQKLDTSGTRLWDDGGVAFSTSTLAQNEGFYHMNSEEQLVCYWQAGSSEDLYCQAISDDGNPVSAERVTVSTTGSYAFSNVGIQLDFSILNGSGTVDISRMDEPAAGFSITTPADVWWRIEEEASITGFNTDIVFDYTDFLGAMNENNLRLFVNEGAGWNEYPMIDLDTINNTITALNASNFSDWTFGEGEIQPLPVELSSFAAIAALENGVILHWTVQSESGLSGYNVLRNNNSTLSTALTINGNLIPAQNSSQEYTYSFEDREIEVDNSYYYWLQSVDINGTGEFYGPVAVFIEPEDEGNGTQQESVRAGIVSIYPNPFNPSTTISFHLNEPAFIGINIFNTRGQLVKTYTDYKSSEGDYTFAFDGRSKNGKELPSGIYHVVLNNGNESFVRKMVLIK
ncbi:MAG: T9SS type A sorting domain-containing protein [Candidatus Cloacimonetes bacterium]|nr:T9SS type A sorting domain-containing protein [Candidatus Cloacimonadota bacterium]